MEIQQSWRVRLSFKNATIVFTLFNLAVALFLLHGFISTASARAKLSTNLPNSDLMFMGLATNGLTVQLGVGAVNSLSEQIIFTVTLSAVRLKLIKEAEEMRLAMQPLELIKRVREIEQEVYAEPEKTGEKEAKQTAAFDLSKRLKDFRSLNDAGSTKALEEWRKRKMERARQRELEKNGTSSS